MTSGVFKIAFVSPHCVLDFTNGAATATRDGLRMLIEQGFECQAYCGTRLDEPQEGLLQESLFKRGVRYEVRKVRIPMPSLPSPRASLPSPPAPITGESPSPPAPLPGTGEGRPSAAPLPGTGGGTSADGTRSLPATMGRFYEARLLFTVDGKLPVTVFENASTRGSWLNVQEAEAFLTGVDLFLRKFRPDVVWPFGGDPASIAVQKLAKRLKMRVLFALHNFSYFDRRAFENVDCVAVPAEFSRRYYKEKLGLDCGVLPNIVNWEAAEVREMGREGDGESGGQADGTRSVPATFVTFINPHAVKGVYVFARIARELARRRPDIPILVTQGRSRADALKVPELGLGPHLAGKLPAEPGVKLPCDGRNIFTMPFTPDPRSFYPKVYSLTRLLLMPSLWNESFGLVAAEAMLNGIPVLASNRGALPDTSGGPHPGPLPEVEGGYLFDIPAKYTPESREVPAAGEVEPWVDTIVRLWDDAAEYERRSQAARCHAQRWRPERLAPIYRDFFNSLANRKPQLGAR